MRERLRSAHSGVAQRKEPLRFGGEQVSPVRRVRLEETVLATDYDGMTTMNAAAGCRPRRFDAKLLPQRCA
jgi:hypothetical protein